jgi:hypothetical protein
VPVGFRKGKKQPASGTMIRNPTIGNIYESAEVRTSNAPCEQEIRCHCYSKRCQPVGECCEASSETLDANREDLTVYKSSH